MIRLFETIECETADYDNSPILKCTNVTFLEDVGPFTKGEMFSELHLDFYEAVIWSYNKKCSFSLKVETHA